MTATGIRHDYSVFVIVFQESTTSKVSIHLKVSIYNVLSIDLLALAQIDRVGMQRLIPCFSPSTGNSPSDKGLNSFDEILE
jgi:hypothetical protein